MIFMLARPAFYLDSARRGLSLYATSVLPSLFPFYFCSLLLTYMDTASVISNAFRRPVNFLYGAKKESAYILLMSMLSGYPVGASLASEMYLAGVFDGEDVKRVFAFCSTSGPVFVLATVGVAIMNDVKAGVIILCCHYLANLLNGFLYRKKRREPSPMSVMALSNADGILSKTISTSTLSMLYVGGYIVLMGMVVDTMTLVGLDELILRAFGSEVGSHVLALLFGGVEMTRGCIAASVCFFKIPLACGIISFGGLSVILQSYTFLSKAQMKLGEVILRKLTHAVIAFLLALPFAFLTA